MSHQAPHDPYHLPKDWRNRHVGEYDKGWDMVRHALLKKQKELVIMPENAQLAERMRYVPDYSIPAPAIMAVIGKKMELYAGLVKNVDYHIGRLIYINRAIRRIIIIDLPVRELPAYSLRGEILILLRP